LRIILSTDAEPEKVVGREIPLTKGIGGWVFQRKQPSFKNPADVDPHHFDLVDKAAGTNTGGGAILTIPLIAGNTCEGVIQFMKTKGGRFEESDIQVATRLAPSITRLVVQLQDSVNADIPSVAYGDMRRSTILFADITGYSEIAAKLRLHDTVGLLNEYYSRLVPFAIGRDGKLEEYLGDGLYVSFSQEAAGQAARLAVTTAFEMHAEYQKILHGWKEYQHPVSDRNTHRIGIASGTVYTGLVGHPDQRRSKLIGAPVDLAAHLCEDVKAFGGGIAICPQTKELIGDEWSDLKRHRLVHGDAWTVTPLTKSG
jgi:class 3 adenylate cyclase